MMVFAALLPAACRLMSHRSHEVPVKEGLPVSANISPAIPVVRQRPLLSRPEIDIMLQVSVSEYGSLHETEIARVGLGPGHAAKPDQRACGC